MLYANKSNAYVIKVEYQFVDAIIERRIDINLPEWNRFEILGIGRVFIDGISNDLLGQIDVSSDEEKFKLECLIKAKSFKKSMNNLTISGTTDFLPKGGYKSLFYLKQVSCD